MKSSMKYNVGLRPNTVHTHVCTHVVILGNPNRIFSLWRSGLDPMVTKALVLDCISMPSMERHFSSCLFALIVCIRCNSYLCLFFSFVRPRGREIAFGRGPTYSQCLRAFVGGDQSGKSGSSSTSCCAPAHCIRCAASFISLSLHLLLPVEHLS